MNTAITLARPDDWHLHLRDGAALAHTVPATAQTFGRAIVMPNLAQPITTVALARAYQGRILAQIPAGVKFEPLMTLYLTDTTSPAEISRGLGFIHGVKLYPAGATTHSDNGVTDLKRVYPVLAEMEKWGLPLLVHGEVVDGEVDVFDRERVFIERHLSSLIRHFPGLRIVFEHITTQEAVAFVRAQPQLGATITAHHLLLNRNALFSGGIRPHHYCLPVLKREVHRQALLQAATSGEPQFFLGTDSAPHPRTRKEASCGCAGIYTAPFALELYAEAFATQNALDKLEGFASFHGADFYKLPRPQETLTLVPASQIIPTAYRMGDEAVVPLWAGGEIAWRVMPPSHLSA
jgi:dihydroorotase